MKQDMQDMLLKAPSGALSFTEKGMIINANPYACTLLEYTNDELAGMDIERLLTLPGRIFYQTHFYPLIKLHGHVEEIFLTLQSKNKKDIPVIINGIASGSSTDNDLVFTCSFLPVFNRRKYEDEILQARHTAEKELKKNEALEIVKRELEAQTKELDRQLSALKFNNKELVQIANIISHDLQEPLRKLLLYSWELGKDNLDELFIKNALSVIHKSSKRTRDLLNALQDYLALAVSDALPALVDLQEVFETEVRQVREMYPHIVPAIHGDNLPVIMGIDAQLHTFFNQLLKNAFQFGSRESSLQLHIQAVIVKDNIFNSIQDKYEYADYLQVSFSDEGAGFDPKFNEYIFGVLKRLDPSTPNVGFGLAFCKRIMENHHGKIKAHGTIGKGATFTIMLPVHQ
jgi:phosphoserine phosphatase RsbU/P